MIHGSEWSHSSEKPSVAITAPSAVRASCQMDSRNRTISRPSDVVGPERGSSPHLVLRVKARECGGHSGLKRDLLGRCQLDDRQRVIGPVLHNQVLGVELLASTDDQQEWDYRCRRDPCQHYATVLSQRRLVLEQCLKPVDGLGKGVPSRVSE